MILGDGTLYLCVIVKSIQKHCIYWMHANFNWMFILQSLYYTKHTIDERKRTIDVNIILYKKYEKKHFAVLVQYIKYFHKCKF